MQVRPDSSPVQRLVGIGTISIVLGLLLNAIYDTFEISPKETMGHAHSFLPENIKFWASMILLGLIVYHLGSDLIKIVNERLRSQKMITGDGSCH